MLCGINWQRRPRPDEAVGHSLRIGLAYIP